MAKLLQSRVHVTGDGSYLVNPEQHILQLTKGSNRRQHPAVFAMKCPVEKAVTVCTGQVELATVATHLNNRLGTRYLIINLSDLPYDCSAFRGDLLEFFFPGYPAPPIKTIVQMCVAIDEWVQKQYAASDMQRKLALPATAGGGAAHDMPAPTPKAAGGFARVGSGGAAEQQAPPAVLFHCRTGKGRTAVALSCYLAWAGVLPSPMEALDHVCAGLAMPVEMATIPSQRRFVCVVVSVSIFGMSVYHSVCLRFFLSTGVWVSELDQASNQTLVVLLLACTPTRCLIGTWSTSLTSWMEPNRRLGN